MVVEEISEIIEEEITEDSTVIETRETKEVKNTTKVIEMTEEEIETKDQELITEDKIIKLMKEIADLMVPAITTKAIIKKKDQIIIKIVIDKEAIIKEIDPATIITIIILEVTIVQVIKKNYF